MTNLDIIRQECEYFHDIQHAEFQSQTRKAEVVNCRQQAMYFADKYTNYNGDKIGFYFGSRDRSTVSHSLEVVKTRAEVDKAYARDLEELDKIIKYQIDNYCGKIVKLSLRMTYWRDDTEVPDYRWVTHTFESETEAFKYYRDNQRHILECTISIRRSKKMREPGMIATNKPIPLNLTRRKETY